MMTTWLYSCPFIRFALHASLGIGVFACNPLSASVTISESAYEGRSQFKIETDHATYFFDKAGGGFSRVIDREGNDWVAFSKTPLSEYPLSAAAGYRGIPNLLFGQNNPDAGGGHPGFDRCESRKLNEHTIQTNTLSGKWAWEWSFTDEHATLTVTKVDQTLPYWFLYEGPVGGKWSPKTHFFGTDLGGPRTELPDNNKQLFENWRWVYFGDISKSRVLLAAQIEADTIQDTLWYLGSSHAGIDSADGMVVFGFGRGLKSQPLLRGSGKQFRIGFVETAHSHQNPGINIQSTVTKTAQSWLAN